MSTIGNVPAHLRGNGSSVADEVDLTSPAVTG